jgi:outer membrane protein OmpA-like peptidoglycan-associated protein
MSVLLNDVRVDLPAVHARGKLGGDDAEFYILEEAALPLILQFRIADTTSRVVSITVPSETATRDLESRLAKDGRTEVYGIYFDFAKATIRPESEIVLKEIADVMVKNPGWTLQVEGHTDNIGRPLANQALVDRYHVAPARLTAQGFGASRPKDTNDTLEGRARNRRVELVKR